MAFVAAATSVGAAVLGTGAAAGIGSTIVGGALIGAGVGGLYSAVTGDGNILNSMLTGGMIGGAGAGIGSAMGLGSSAASLPSSAAVPTANVATVTPAMQAAALDAAAVAEGGTTAGMVGAANTGLPANTVLPANMAFTPPAPAAGTGLSSKEVLGYGLAGSAALSLMGDRSPSSAGSMPDAGDIRPYTYSQTINPKYGLPGEPYYVQSYQAQTPYPAKAGGLMKLAYGGPVERMSAMEQDQGMYPQGMMDKTYYSTPSQRPASMEVIKSDYDTPVNPITGIGPQFAGGGKVAFADGGIPDAVEMAQTQQKRVADITNPMVGGAGLGGVKNQGMAPQSMYGQSTPTATGVDMLGLAPNFGQYGNQRQVMNPSVGAYNQILADRATNEYVTQAPLLSMLPGGGERATAADTSKIINEYYLKNLGRQGEQAGLDFWTKAKMDTGMSLADINKAIQDSPEAVARREAQAAQQAQQAQAALEASPVYQEYMAAPITAENFDAAAYLAANPDVANKNLWSGTPWQHYSQYGAGEGRQGFKLPFQQPTTAPTTSGGIGGYTYDKATGTYTKTTPSQSFSGLPDLSFLGIDINDPGFANFLQNQYNQYQQSQYGYGGGGKAGGLMPKALKYADGGETEDDVNKRIMKNIKNASTKDLERMMESMDEQEFLRRNMPNYAAAMSPSISGMIEGAQYGDRMSQARPKDFFVMPTSFSPQTGQYGGIASIGQQLDPDTRLRMMADIQRTPFDRSALEAVRRVGAGIDRKIGKDASLSAFYEQDPMGRNKMGGARFTQRFEQGGATGGQYNLGSYSDGGRLLKGPGDGMSDNIPAVIGKKQPARLAEGEFVVPADVVSHLGNGSTDAGAKRLYNMMDKVRKARTGNKKQGKQIKADKFIPV